MKRVFISGGFDPIHVGHVRYIQEAAKLGQLTVILNSDAWLMRKKGFVFMPWEERREIIEAITGVYQVVSVNDDDGSVCDALDYWRPDIFANGGDRFEDNIPEAVLCHKHGIEMVFNIGGEKTQSSSSLVKTAVENNLAMAKEEASKWW